MHWNGKGFGEEQKTKAKAQAIGKPAKREKHWSAVVPRAEAGEGGTGKGGGESTLAYALEIILAIGRGKLDSAIDTSRDDSGSGILEALAGMQTSLATSLAEFRNASERFHRGSLEMNSSVKALGDNVTQSRSRPVPSPSPRPP